MMLGTRPPILRLLVKCFFSFFFSIRPADRTSRDAFDGKGKKKRGGGGCP